ncbi:MAG: hypothetical protein ACMG6E_09685 [Candidatus Roizmanbacteria bacterium]
MVPEPAIVGIALFEHLPVHESGLARAGHIVTARARAVAVRLFTVGLLARGALGGKGGRRVRHVALMVGAAVSHGLLDAGDHFVFEIMPLLVLLFMRALLLGRLLMTGELSVDYVDIILLYLSVIGIDVGGTMLRYVRVGVQLLLLAIKKELLLLEEQEVGV